MSEVAPFTAIRYTGVAAPGGDLSDVLAPPYDVLSESDKDRLLARSPWNIVAIDLPHLPPKSLGPPEAYARSAKRLAEWLEKGVLARDPKPAMYVYRQRFEHEGKPLVREMVIARVRLRPFSDGVILPHERTFGGPKEDRLALMKATKCNLSPVFGLYQDSENVVRRALAGASASPPHAHGALDAVENELWVVENPDVIGRVTAFFADRTIYIADGHHRYATAMLYREHLARESGGPLPDDHPANHVLFVLAGMDDPGCVILPYHRVLIGVDFAATLAAWRSATEGAPPRQTDLMVVDGRTGRRCSLRFTDRATLDRLEPSQPPAWRQLDAAYLHRYLLAELLPSAKRENQWRIEYVRSKDEALRVAAETAGLALLMNPTPMSHLRAVSEAGGLMPQKSTYFHPKPATGMTIQPLE